MQPRRGERFQRFFRRGLKSKTTATPGLRACCSIRKRDRARENGFPSFSEGVAKPSNVRGSSHKKHKKHKILVPLVARSRSYSRFCNILFQGGESIFPCPVSLSNWATRPCARGYSLAPLRGSIRMRLRRAILFPLPSSCISAKSGNRSRDRLRGAHPR